MAWNKFWLWFSQFSITLVEIKKMSAAIDRLRDDVQQLKSVDESLKQLVLTLAQLVRDNAEDPVALRAIADDVEAQVADITGFVRDNTPATE